MRKCINIMLVLQCVLLLSVTCQAQDVSVNQRQLNRLLDAGEFAQAQRLAEDQAIEGERRIELQWRRGGRRTPGNVRAVEHRVILVNPGI